jgi:class 3 adenylate cyclase
MKNLSESTVLVVDDTEANIDVLVETLGVDYDLAVAMDGESALKIASEDAPDLILLDIMMPGMDGYEVCRRLKADENTREIPVIFVTAMGEIDDETKGLGLGAIDYLTKPVTPSIVQARVRNHLELKRLRDQEKEYLRLVELEKKKSDALLANILPDSVAERLKEKQEVIAESYPEITILFADLINFTEFASKTSSVEIVSTLNEVFSFFDGLAEKHGVEKIKTIGDSYMAVAGLADDQEEHAIQIADLALDMLEGIRKFSWLNGQSLRLRIGINTGPVVAGVIGRNKYSFDMWGDAVNIAGRMEFHGVPDRIQVSAITYQYLRDSYLFEERGPLQIKGKGEMNTYFLIGKKE